MHRSCYDRKRKYFNPQVKSNKPHKSQKDAKWTKRQTELAEQARRQAEHPILLNNARQQRIFDILPPNIPHRPRKMSKKQRVRFEYNWHDLIIDFVVFVFMVWIVIYVYMYGIPRW